MALSARLRSAGRAALLHMGISLLVAAAVAWVVFGVWYPAPLHELTGGRNLFLILMAVDVVCGPMLTLVLYNPTKSRLKWRLDLALIVLMQMGAMAYGLAQVAAARPVFMAFEGNRFRIVQAFDVDATRLSEAPEGMQTLGFSGPRPIGVRLSRPDDPDFLSSVQLSTQGLHPSFRSSRWRPLEDQLSLLQRELRPLIQLRQKNPNAKPEIDAALARMKLQEEQVGYLPLVREEVTDWVALVERSTGQPRAYLHLEGW